MKNIQNLTIDINKKPFQTITANVGEVASRFIRITILENNVPADLTGVTAYLYAKKADGTKVFNSVKVEDPTKGIVLAELTSQVLAIPGLVKLTLLLTKDGAKLASKQIIVTVDESNIDEEAIQSRNEFNALTDALKKVNNIDNKLDKNSILSMANMGQDVKEAMTGGSVAVVGVNTILTENIIDEQVTPEKTTFINIDKGLNLFNVDAIETGGYLDYNNEYKLGTDAKYVSEYIKIDGTKNISVDFGTSADGYNRIFCYDAKKIYLGNVYNADAPTNRYQTLTPKDGTVYIRVSGNTARTPYIVIVEGDEQPTTYIPYRIDYTLNKNINLKKSSISAEHLDFVTVTKSINLFDYKKIINGLASGSVDSVYYPNESNASFVHYVLDCKPNTTYIVSSTDYYIKALDENNVVLANMGNPSSHVSNVVVTTPNNCAKLAVNINLDVTDIETYMIIEGSSMPGEYIPYFAKIKFDYDVSNENIHTELKDSSVDVKHLNFATVTTSINLFNYKKVIDGLGSGSVGDTYYPNNSHTDFVHCVIDCKPNTTYTVSGTSYYYRFLDKNGIVIAYGGASSGNVSNVSFTTPSNCVKFVINFRHASFPLSSYMIVEGSTMPDNYIAYLNEIKFDYDISQDNLPLSIGNSSGHEVGYISPTGDDANIGSKKSPKATIQNCIDNGFTTIIAKPGKYHGQTLNVTTEIEKMQIMGDFSTTKSGVTLYAEFDNSQDLVVELDSSTGLYCADYVVNEDSNFYKVFVDKSLPPIRDGLRSVSYNAIVWETYGDIISDVKLVPVLTLTECQATKGTFYYDYANSKIYINPTNEAVEYKVLIDEESILFNLNNIKNLVIENIKILYSAGRCLYLNNVNNATINNCEFGYSAYSSNATPDNTNIRFTRCNSYKACGDGFAPIGCGNQDFIDCNGFYNYDDGLSHHDGCTGTVIGGEYYNNKKGGNAPAHGATVNMYNVISYNNGYGFYCEASRNIGRTQNLVGCIAYNNNIGLSVYNYHVKAFNCNFDNNTKAINETQNENTSLTIL